MCDREGSAVNYKRSCAGQIAGVIKFFHPTRRALQPTGTRVMVLTSGQYEIFKAVSKRFLEEEKVGFVETEAAMATVFGLDRSSQDARARPGQI